MAVKTFTARDLNQRSSLVTHAVDEGFEVIITKHGRPVYRITPVASQAAGQSLLDAMRAAPDTSAVDVAFERVQGTVREVDL